MRPSRRSSAAITCVLLSLVWRTAPAARAQDAEPAPAPLADAAAGVRAGHSMHGEAFDEGPRQAAYLMPGTGRVRFPITAKNPDAQRFFEQGVGQLHGFWYFEAERSFRQAAALDRECAMAYWGMAVANINNANRAKAFVKEAVARKQHASPREAMWIDGLDEFYHGAEQDEAKRRRQHVRKLEAIVQAYPDDIEAKAFLTWGIWDNRFQLPISSHQALDTLIDQVLLAEPMHPAHHYRIHLWDDEKPERAVASAARAGQASPGIAHMWHMPGHTYSKLHRYEDAAFQQEASARVDHAHMVRDRVMPYEIHNYAHNNAWCVETLAYVGRVRDAVELAKNLGELPRHPKHNNPSNGGSAAAMGRDRLIDVLVAHELWDEYLALSGGPYLDGAGESPEQKVRRLRYLGVAYAAKGSKDKADEQAKALEAMKAESDALVAANEPKEDDDAAAVEAKKKSKPDADKARDQSGRIVKALAHVRGQLAAAAGDFAGAVTQFDQSDLRKEHLSQAYLAAGNLDRAEQLAREAVDAAPDQCYPLANQVDALFRRGKPAEAGEAFAKLRKLSAAIDLSAPVYARLAPVAQSLGFPADWRLPRPLPTDVLPRPDLNALGPFRWHPVPAPEWSLPAADGQTLALSGFRGRPVVVVFYLGHGCLHCVEQLNAFVPLAAEFKQAGIDVVAVSTDSVPNLSQSVTAAAQPADPSAPAAGFPFPLVSDESMGAFKAYRAFDDFEGRPLHGTFLVDAAGLVRWQDVSAEPFTDVRFLLDESKRLLAQPAAIASN